jgi:hypothetical protein
MQFFMFWAIILCLVVMVHVSSSLNESHLDLQALVMEGGGETQGILTGENHSGVICRKARSHSMGVCPQTILHYLTFVCQNPALAIGCL